MKILSEANRSYESSLYKPRTLRINHLLLANLQALDLIGTWVMVSKHGIGSEANEVAKQLLGHHDEIIAFSKLMIIPVVVTIATSMVYEKYKKRQFTHDDCYKWPERVIIMLQSLNTVYTFAFLIIVIADLGNF